MRWKESKYKAHGRLKRIWVFICQSKQVKKSTFTFVHSAESTFADFIQLGKSDTFTRNFDFGYEFVHVVPVTSWARVKWKSKSKKTSSVSVVKLITLARVSIEGFGSSAFVHEERGSVYRVQCLPKRVFNGQIKPSSLVTSAMGSHLLPLQMRKAMSTSVKEVWHCGKVNSVVNNLPRMVIRIIDVLLNALCEWSFGWRRNYSTTRCITGSWDDMEPFFLSRQDQTHR